MPIMTVLLTDTFDQWRQKTNQMIDVVNTLSGTGDILSVSSPTGGQILVADGTGLFKNVSVTGDISISSAGVATFTGTYQGYTKGRLRFAGSMTGLY